MSDSSCGCGHSKNLQESTPEVLTLTTTPTNAENTTGETAESPVMVGTLLVKAAAETKGLYRDYEGKRYWLCCPGCRPKFDAHPVQHAHAG